jgi:hypothetical protein
MMDMKRRDVTDMSSPNDDDAPWGYSEAAKFLGLRPDHLRLLVHRRQLPHVRVTARRVAFLPSELRAWRAARRVGEAK